MEDLIYKFIRGNISQEERERVLAWLAESESNRELYIDAKKRYIKESFPNKQASEKDISRFRERLAKERRAGHFYSGSLMNRFIKIAAALFIPLLLVTGYLTYDRLNSVQYKDEVSQLNEYVYMDTTSILTYHTNPGVKGFVQLPDGSSVVLNSSSKIKIPVKFNKTKRVVELEGEGYFDIKSDTDWPMYVNTTKGVSVKVLGTTFNLSSYNNDGELKLTLISGLVKLITDEGRREIDVQPLQEVVIPDNREVPGVRRSANVELNTGWKDGILIFENTSMDEVVKKMERWFGADINVSNRKLLEYRFTARFSSESLSQVLELIKLSTNINYSVRDNNIVTLFID